MKSLTTQELTLTAVLTAMILMLGLIPNIGFISVTPMVGFTIIHIPVLIGAYFGSRRVGGFLGLVFGLTSLFVAWTRPTGALDPIFTNPFVSVLPRFLVGYFAYDVLHFLRNKLENKFVTDALFFTIMTLMHSILVVSLLYIAGVNHLYFDLLGIADAITRDTTLGVIEYVATYFGTAGFFGFLMTILVVNSILEIVMCTLIGVPVVDRLKKALNTNTQE